MNSLTRACCSLLLVSISATAAANVKYFQYDPNADTGAATLYELTQAWLVRQFLKENAHDNKISAHVRLSSAIDIAEAGVVIQELPMALNKGREDIYLKLAPLTEGVNAMLFDGMPPWGVYVSARDRADLLRLLAKHDADYTLAYEAYGHYGSPLDHYLISHSGKQAPIADLAVVELMVSRGATVNARTLTFDLPPQVRRAVAKSCVADGGGDRSD